MGESEWVASTEPQPMLEFLRNSGGASERRLRLFAVACSRRVWHLLTDERCRNAVVVAESHADGGADDEQLFAAWGALPGSLPRMVPDRGDPASLPSFADSSTLWVAWCHRMGRLGGDVMTPTRAAEDVENEACGANRSGYGQADEVARVRERVAQADLLRHIFGNPFAALPRIDPIWLSWNDGLIRNLAERAYELRSMPDGNLDPDRLAVLADALEEVGADDSLLVHLRGPGPHVRGDWAVDLLLGKG